MKSTAAINTMISPCASRRGVLWGGMSLALGLLLLLGNLQSGSAAGVMIMGNLANFDVRYPQSLPNDLEIILYGDGLKPSDVVGTYVNAQWGQPTIAGGTNNDPNSPGFGLDCVIVRYAGPPLPELVGQLLHFGVRLRPGAVAAHQEVWWTINGQRVHRPCDPQVTWLCTTNGWLVCIQNPTPQPIYIYGCRFFELGPTAPLPLLAQMNTGIQPQQFGGTWQPVPPPFGRVFCIQPWCRIYFRVRVVRWRPIIFQIGARNVPEEQQPLPNPDPLSGPDPQDFNPQTGNGTMAILTTRPTEEHAEDLDNNGAVGTSDFNMFRLRFGAVSEDRGQTQ